MNPIDWYNANAKEISSRYENLSPERLHSWLLKALPSEPCVILDVGAGSGRDATWLSSLGHEVIAVEPSSEMRQIAAIHHPNSPVRWFADFLPDLKQIFKAGLSFDVILLSAVWMHIKPKDRQRAFRKLISLLKPGGILAISLRFGPAESTRGIFPVSEDEIEKLVSKHGAFIESKVEDSDNLGRIDVHWSQVIIRRTP